MIKAFVGNKSLRRAVEIRTVNLATKKSKSFSIQVEEDTKAKNYDVAKISRLLEKLLDEYVRKEGGLKLNG